MTQPLLDVRNLRVQFDTDDGVVRAVDDVSFQIFPREVFAIVGESGSGKTVTALSILDLIPKPHGRIVNGKIVFKGQDLLRMDPEGMRKLRGSRITMIFQDPLTALNPVYSVGHQIAEVFRTHEGIRRKDGVRRAVDLLDLVGIPRPDERVNDYPHQFSGGMRQRVMIAMAIAMNPDLIIADEPTTALDVTIQAQILDILLKVREEFNAAIMLITHDLGVVAGVAQRVMVMYAGKVAEIATTDDLYIQPKHPYAWGLMTSVTRLDRAKKERLLPIRGAPPSLINVPPGCPFNPRCPYAKDICREEYPVLRAVGTGGHFASCHFADQPDWTPPPGLVVEKAG